MAITAGTVSVAGLNNEEIKLQTQNNSANGSKNPCHPLLDAAGAIINPATSENQATANAALAAIQAAVAKIPASPANSANQDTANTKLDTLIANTAPGSVNLYSALTVTAALHPNGNIAGGKVSLAGAARVAGGSGLIQTVLVNKKTNLSAPVDVYFFNADPASVFAENQALPDFSADYPGFIGVAHCTDVIDHGTAKTLQAANLALPFKLASGTTLYAVPVMRGSETFGSTSELSLLVTVVRN